MSDLCKNCEDNYINGKEACDNCEYELVLRQLADYEQKIADGRVIERPCKIGDTIYNQYGDKYTIYLMVAAETEKDPVYFRYFAKPEENTNDKINFFDDKIGKTVFLTRDEAEKALEGET